LWSPFANLQILPSALRYVGLQPWPCPRSITIAFTAELPAVSGIKARVQIPPSALKYVESQPWPFPQSMMIAFTVELPDPIDSVDQGSEEEALAGLPLSQEGRRAAKGLGLPIDELVRRALLCTALEA
jgi:hypothetical protein